MKQEVSAPSDRQRTDIDLDARLRLFDEATERQRRRDAARKVKPKPASDHGWKREDLYTPLRTECGVLRYGQRQPHGDRGLSDVRQIHGPIH